MTKANMPTARDGGRLVWFENRIWVIGGRDDGSDAINKVESYDPKFQFLEKRSITTNC